MVVDPRLFDPDPTFHWDSKETDVLCVGVVQHVQEAGLSLAY